MLRVPLAGATYGAKGMRVSQDQGGTAVSGRWRDVIDEEGRRVLANYRRPRDTAWDDRRTGLLIIDVVESFVGPDVPVLEAQRVAATACGQFARRAVPRIGALLGRFRELGEPVVYTVVGTRQESVGAATRGATRDEPGVSASTVIPELAPQSGELVIVKDKASAFFATSLISYLVREGVGRVVLTGGATSGCVRATAVDATSYGLDVKLVEDATFDRVPQLHDTSLLDVDTKYGQVMTTDAVLQELAS